MVDDNSMSSPNFFNKSIIEGTDSSQKIYTKIVWCFQVLFLYLYKKQLKTPQKKNSFVFKLFV